MLNKPRTKVSRNDDEPPQLVNQNSNFNRVMLSDLKVVSWNANGVFSQKYELLEYLEEDSPDIVLVNETHLKPTMAFTICNYKVYRQDRTHAIKGGVAILIKSYIKHTFIGTIQTVNIENISIKFPLENNEPITLTAAYISPTKTLLESDLDALPLK